jgi:hypothetical protein
VEPRVSLAVFGVLMLMLLVAAPATPTAGLGMPTADESRMAETTPARVAALQADLPDLGVGSAGLTWLGWTGGCRHGDESFVTWVHVVNVGRASARSFAVDIDRHYDAPGRLRVQRLSPGETAPLYFLSGGAVTVRVDPLDEVEEISEENNTAHRAFAIPSPPPTCTPTSPAATRLYLPLTGTGRTPTPLPPAVATFTPTPPVGTLAFGSVQGSSENPGNPAALAIDGNPDTFWRPMANQTAQYLQANFGTAQTVQTVRFSVAMGDAVATATATVEPHTPTATPAGSTFRVSLLRPTVNAQGRTVPQEVERRALDNDCFTTFQQAEHATVQFNCSQAYTGVTGIRIYLDSIGNPALPPGIREVSAYPPSTTVTPTRTASATAAATITPTSTRTATATATSLPSSTPE